MDVKLYRKRMIPEECIYLKDDIIVHQDEKHIITKWNTLRKRPDFSHGISCYYLEDGFKISKFYAEDGHLVYWYCDIIETTYDAGENSFLFTDLLADVIIYPDGFVKVVDLDELAEAFRQQAISEDQMQDALIRLNTLLTRIYSYEFTRYSEYIESFE